MSQPSLDALIPSLTGPRDQCGAFVLVEGDPGWSAGLLRMYQRFAERMGWKWSWIDGDPAKHPAPHPSGLLLLEGMHAFGLLRGETGIHALADGERFSFAAVDVVPDIHDPLPKDEVRIEMIPLGERAVLA